MASIDTASEDVPESFCQPCADDCEHLPADVYCTDCQEYLCSTCYAHHRTGRAYKKHKSEMPKSQSTSVKIDTCTEQCPQHKHEIISFYCKSHDQLGCHRCKATGHIVCQVSTIADVVKDMTQSQECKEFIQKLNAVQQRFGSVLSLSKRHVDEVEEYYSKTLEAVKNVITKSKEENLKTMKAVSDTSSAVIAEIQETTTKLETLQKHNQNSQMFMVMRNVTSQLKLFEDSFCKIETDNKIKRYEFRAVKQQGTNENVLGQLCMLGLPASVGDIDVKTTSDPTRYYYITGCSLLSDNRLVIADCGNLKIKLVDLDQNKVASELKLSSNPWDVTMIDNTHVAVTFCRDQKIQILHTTSSSLSEDREIKVSGLCWGIAHNDGTLIVTFRHSGKVEMMDMNGNALRSVTQDSSGAQLFADPYNIAISPDKTAIYVSDHCKHTVTCMSMDGTVKSVYKDDDLKGPRGLAVDETGVVYVCGDSSNNIHQITAECTKIRVLLGQEHGISSPCSVTYSDTDGTLYVGMDNHNVVKVFKVK